MLNIALKQQSSTDEDIFEKKKERKKKDINMYHAKIQNWWFVVENVQQWSARILNVKCIRVVFFDARPRRK